MMMISCFVKWKLWCKNIMQKVLRSKKIHFFLSVSKKFVFLYPKTEKKTWYYE